MKHSTLEDANQAALWRAQLFDFLGCAVDHPGLRDCKLSTLTSVLHEAIEELELMHHEAVAELEVMDKKGERFDSYDHSST